MIKKLYVNFKILAIRNDSQWRSKKMEKMRLNLCRQMRSSEMNSLTVVFKKWAEMPKSSRLWQI